MFVQPCTSMTEESSTPKASVNELPEILPPETAKELAKEIGEEGVKKVEGVLVASQITMGGPLPVSSEFAAYDDVLPGAAREILDMAKSEQAHRHHNNTKDINWGITHQFLALVLGVTLLGGCIFGAVYLALKGEAVIAGLLLGVAVLGVITTIITSKPVFSGRPEDSPKED